MTEYEALENLDRAWRILPRGNHSPQAIEAWLRDHMGPAILEARAVLERHLR